MYETFLVMELHVLDRPPVLVGLCVLTPSQVDKEGNLDEVGQALYEGAGG